MVKQECTGVDYSLEERKKWQLSVREGGRLRWLRCWEPCMYVFYGIGP